jgi:DNA-binding GntR family transcriptional regulator
VTVGSTDDGRDVVERVRDAILIGELSPGQRLVEAELTERFAASRGTVRQALLHLEGLGLVTRERNRGARVRAITLEEAVEVWRCCRAACRSGCGST